MFMAGGWEFVIKQLIAARKEFSTRWELAYERVVKNFTLKAA